MADEFSFDVFLSHSSKDKAIARDVAERLRRDGLRVWFDEWVLRAGDSIPAKIEEGLEHSRVLACPAVASARRRMLCMSANAFSRSAHSWKLASLGGATVGAATCSFANG
jgi:hypothetical protein